MDLEYRGSHRLNLERVHPKRPNSCRLSICANTVNLFRGRPDLTPEAVLVDINSRRIANGGKVVNLDEEAIGDEEIESYIATNAEGVGLHYLEGPKAVNYTLWDALVDAGFAIVPDHQMIYSDPLTLLKSELNYLPPDLVRRLVHEEDFSYQTFLDLYSFFISRAGHFEEGHVDMVLDVTKVNGLDSVVLANFASKGNEFPLSVPWNFFKNYLSFDWYGPAIDSVDQLPDEATLKRIMAGEKIEFGGRNFFYASIEIYYPKDKKGELDAIIQAHAS